MPETKKSPVTESRGGHGAKNSKRQNLMGGTMNLYDSILPAPPEKMRRVSEVYGTEEYVSVGCFPPGSPRQIDHAHGIGSLFLDADAADYVLYHCVDPAELRELGLTEVEALKRTKRGLHQLPQAKLEELLDEHLAFLQRILDWAGIRVTHITRSGYGHHVHVWLDDWAVGPTAIQRVRDLVEQILKQINGHVGYGLLDTGARNGPAQLCRDVGMANNKGVRPQTVRRVGGEPEARLGRVAWSLPQEELEGVDEIKSRVEQIRACLVEIKLPHLRGAGGSKVTGTISSDTPLDGLGAVGAIAADLAEDQKSDPIHCPLHDDRSASAVVYHWGLFCSVCGSFRVQEPREIIPDLSSKDLDGLFCSEGEEAGEDEQDDDEPKYLSLDLSGRAEPIVIVHGDLGAGKSVWAGKQIAEVETALVTMHRRALARDCSQNLGVVDYQDLPEGEIRLAEVKKLVITPNSLWRVVDLPEVVPELLIVEESESTMEHWYGGTMRRRGARRGAGGTGNDDTGHELVGGAAFRRLLSVARSMIEANRRDGGQRKILLLDAHVGLVTETLAEQMAHHCRLDPETSIFRHRHEVEVEWDAYMWDSIWDLLAQIEAWTSEGERVAISCTSARDARGVAELCRQTVRQDGTLPEVLLHWSRQRSDARSALRNVREGWAKADIVVYSPTVDAGVSYDRADAPFDHRVVIGRKPAQTRGGIPSYGWRKPLQMSRRVRDRAVTDPDIHLWIDPTWMHRRSVARREVIKQRDALVRATKAAVGRAGGSWDQVSDREHLEVGLAVEQSRRIETKDVSQAVADELERAGALIGYLDPVIVDEDAKHAWRERYTALREQADRREAGDVAAARGLTLSEYLEREDVEDLDDEDALAVRRSSGLDFFGRIDEELAYRDLRGGERKAVSQFCTGRLLSEGRWDLVARPDLQAGQAGYRMGAEARLMTAALVWGVGRPLGLPDVFHTVRQGCDKTAEEGSSQSIFVAGQPAENTIESADASDLKSLVGAELSQRWVGTVPDGMTLDEIRDRLDAPDLIDTDDIKDAWLKSIAGTRRHLASGTGISQDPQVKPLSLIRQILAFWGLKHTKLSEHDVRGHDGRRHKVRVYTIDPERLAELAELSERTYARAVGDDVPILDEIDPKLCSLDEDDDEPVDVGELFDVPDNRKEDKTMEPTHRNGRNGRNGPTKISKPEPSNPHEPELMEKILERARAAVALGPDPPKVLQSSQDVAWDIRRAQDPEAPHMGRTPPYVLEVEKIYWDDDSELADQMLERARAAWQGDGPMPKYRRRRRTG